MPDLLLASGLPSTFVPRSGTRQKGLRNVDSDAEQVINHLKGQRETAGAHRDEMDFVLGEVRKALLDAGADKYLLKELELGAISVALSDANLRGMDAQIENLEAAAEDR
jgi:hypothetical protein